MKKAAVIMIILTAVFAFTMLGIFLGRTTKDGTISVYTANSVRSETVDNEEPKPAGLININTATVEELQQLPGIGEVTANAIIAYREEKGPFQIKRDLLKVKGIGEKTYEELKNMITTKEPD